MNYVIRMGVPEMEDFWNDLVNKYSDGNLTKNEQLIFNKLVKTIRFLQSDPGHPGLQTHEISQLSKRYGIKVWQSYLENKKPAAGRLFWVYGPAKREITIIAIEPHPEDKKGSYKKIKLSDITQ